MGQFIDDNTRALKWVLADVEAGPLRATEAAGRVLAKVQPDQPLNVVTIVGAARKGKSFLMNALTRQDGMFRASAGTPPCTAGADLSQVLMRLSDFKSGRVGTIDQSTSDPTIAFVDMEGQGDKSTDHDVRLATPFLLVSKVVLYNWMSLPNKHKMLEELEVMVQAADKVSAENNQGQRDFGHLIILVRDVGGSERAEEVKRLVLDDEEAGHGKTKLAQRNALNERNAIRDGLREGFASITVHAMPRPHPQCGDRVVDMPEVCDEFIGSVDQLRDIITKKLSTPHVFAGKKIAGGRHTHEIVDALCAAVNSAEDVSPPSVLEAIYIRRARQANADALVSFDNMVESVFGGRFVLSSLDTKTAIDSATVSVLEEFDLETKGISDGIAQAQREDLKKQIAPKAEVVARNQEEKRRELDKRMEAMVRDSEASITTKVRELEFPMDETVFSDKWDELVSSHFQDLERKGKAMVTEDDVPDEVLYAELDWSVSEAKFKELVKGVYGNAQELNRMATAGKNDKKAKEDAEKKAEELTGQAAKLTQQVDKALKEAEQARDAAAQARTQAKNDAKAQLQHAYDLAAMQSAPPGSCMPAMQDSQPQRRRGAPAGHTLTFYKGGRFVPGGGRAPKGGGYFYKKT